MKRFLDIPGIARVEHGLNLKNALWAPENDDLEDRVAALSIQHFGRTVEQTVYEFPERFLALYDENDPYDDEEGDEVTPDRQYVYDVMSEAGEWNLHFEVLDLPFEQQIPLWTALGWDVTDGKGDQPKCLERFERQLLAHAKGLPVMGAAAASKVDAESWGAKLAAEAERFSGTGRR